MNCDICGRENLAKHELEIHNKYFHKIVVNQPPQKFATGVCPECGLTLWFEEGCASCHGCGFSKCG
uniref:Putative ribonucleoside diphosphate reductase n=1 Tax=viral metagenome TaxID=1070528 RepID=A0A6H1ZFY4_9ZZZZ